MEWQGDETQLALLCDTTEESQDKIMISLCTVLSTTHNSQQSRSTVRICWLGSPSLPPLLLRLHAIFTALLLLLLLLL